VERKEDVLTIPNSTVQSYFNRRYVLVKDGDRKVEVDVELGISDGERTEVIAGLEEGELVFER
jgi:multidrug efflux pump subunit AcrA (membrane-fusion protein)